ncbi:carboxylating nicotinate-nucleotide diphosphorylase [Nocardioides sp. TRM66260-LWL]|uniref:carboxylating nicotinate-nucleotide diphosphorylase n=1 Tax=Nocardioides sp. TRM66260-LWL TaxID=2874478 RepID=UPI001CC5E788|nr:carboxylating nicotinate-nucleotide diphosphorylase [Nocardioides sp. TRM66260-LWL]MBZ5734859.1 carboxylating nicotinate-nucleotide diphosphorylase [Nocardioides sp. TRM66260-LWL]
MIARTPLADLPAALVAELREAGLDPEAVHAHVALAFEEDLPGGADDATSAAMPDMGRAVADVASRETGVVAGLAIAELAFRYVLGDDVTIAHRAPDGSRVAPGNVVLTVEGPVRGVLTAERTALNFASHLSGVATATAAWVDALEGTRARVLDTRKTLPGWRALQKYAVRCGGGLNHRFSLVDRAMVKDNHVVAAGGVVEAYRRVLAASPGLRVEVEVTTLEELDAVLEAGCTEVLLDNMEPATLAEAVRRTAGRASLEASGGLTLERARVVAETGVDFISVGALTHSVRVFDLGLDFREH